jgi:hypothetical protein
MNYWRLDISCSISILLTGISKLTLPRSHRTTDRRNRWCINSGRNFSIMSQRMIVRTRKSKHKDMCFVQMAQNSIGFESKAFFSISNVGLSGHPLSRMVKPTIRCQDTSFAVQVEYTISLARTLWQTFAFFRRRYLFCLYQFLLNRQDPLICLTT